MTDGLSSLHRRRMFASALLIGLAALLGAGCPMPPLPGDDAAPNAQGTPPDDAGPGDASQPTPGTTGNIAGQLTVQNLAPQTILEEGFNDDLVSAQHVGSLRPGMMLSILGYGSAADDVFDGYEFFAREPVTVSVEVVFDDDGQGEAEDFDLAVYDFLNGNCAPGSAGEAEFALCFDGQGRPERGTFVARGPFVLVVSAFAGAGEYRLNVHVSTAPEGHGATLRAPVVAVGEAGPAVKAGGPALTAAFADVSEGVIPGELVVDFQPQVVDEERVLEQSGTQRLERSPSGRSLVSCPAVREIQAAGPADENRKRVLTLRRRAILRSDPRVRRVDINRRLYATAIPNDSFYSVQWQYQAMNLPEAWDQTTGSDDIIVAVVDTGIVSSHPDLQGRLTPGADFINDPVSARDGDGRDFDPEDLGDQIGGVGQSSFHGTHVAGIIAASSNNGMGVSGVTWQTRIMPLRALGTKGGTSFDVSEAIRYAAGLPNISGQVPPKPARIINLSLSGPAGSPPTEAERSAIVDAVSAGVLVVAAAGNESTSRPAAPASIPEVISVSALDIQNRLARYSNFGPTIDLAAPGGSNATDFNGDGYVDGILSTGASDRNGTITPQYIISSGTSMAAPQVAGVAALVMAANPALNAAQVRQILQSTARDLGAPGRDDQFGHGLINAAAAVNEALRQAGATSPDQPVMSLTTYVVNMGPELTEFHVGVSNTGGGILQIGSILTHTDTGDRWLSAAAVGSAENASANEIVITVNRAALPNGIYRGTVTVHAEGTLPAVIEVSMSVGPLANTMDIIYVLAVSPDSFQTTAQAQTSAAQGFAYQMAGVPSGQYVIYAGTDRDNDGMICEVGDLCGALPSVIDPQQVEVKPGETRGQVDFAVAQVVLQPLANASQPPQLRRLR